MSGIAAHAWPSGSSSIPNSILFAFGVCVVLFFGLGQFLFPIYVLAALPVAAACGIYLIRSARFAMYVFIACTVLLSFGRGTTNNASSTGGFDLAIALLFTAVTMIWVYRALVLERAPVTFEGPQLLANAYLAWGLFTGIGGMLWWNNTSLDWIREFLILCPLFFIPTIYLRYFPADSKEERTLHRFAFGAAIVVMVWAVLRYAINLATAMYAYQIGRFTFDTSASTIVLLVCFAFTLYRVRWIPMWLRYGLAAFCVGTLVIASFRTIWASTALSVLILFFIAPKAHWKGGLKFLGILGAALAAIGTYMFFTVKIFQIFMTMTIQRFLTTAELKTDLSLVHRYIETDIVWNHVLASPVTGYGFGATFQLWDFMMGISYQSGYSHNGYTFVLFKTGFVGFILIFTAYFWMMHKGLKIARDLTESPRVRALAGIGFCYLVCMLVSNYTLNIFGERNVLVWISLFWGFFLSREIAKKQSTSADSDPLPSTIPA